MQPCRDIIQTTTYSNLFCTRVFEHNLSSESIYFEDIIDEVAESINKLLPKLAINPSKVKYLLFHYNGLKSKSGLIPSMKIRNKCSLNSALSFALSGYDSVSQYMALNYLYSFLTDSDGIGIFLSHEVTKNKQQKINTTIYESTPREYKLLRSTILNSTEVLNWDEIENYFSTANERNNQANLWIIDKCTPKLQIPSNKQLADENKIKKDDIVISLISNEKNRYYGKVSIKT
ncbi:hypothetical protein ACTHO0_19095 [Cytobacillus praedii]|uniref:hypothetical protein n=1 Tax=Cytobacillus praedii TaxID=1742358 RepID=UPI003F7EDEED